MLNKQINTIKKNFEFTYKEKGSEFIAKVFPVSNELDSTKQLINIKKQYFDATHHCYAYKLNGNIFKYSDDGEPKGTAGVRILNAIDHFELVDVLLVVIRYFGGTKLGVGPLGKAYYNSARDVLQKSEILKLNLYQLIEITVDFSSINNFHHLINNYQANIVDTYFSNHAKFICMINPTVIDKITSELTNLTNGQAKISVKNEFIYK